MGALVQCGGERALQNLKYNTKSDSVAALSHAAEEGLPFITRILVGGTYTPWWTTQWGRVCAITPKEALSWAEGVPAQRPFSAGRGWSHIVDERQRYDIGLTHVFATAEAADTKVRQLNPPLKKPCTDQSEDQSPPSMSDPTEPVMAESASDAIHNSPPPKPDCSDVSPMTWLPGVEVGDRECPATQLHLSATGSVLDDNFNRTPEFDLSDRELARSIEIAP